MDPGVVVDCSTSSIRSSKKSLIAPLRDLFVEVVSSSGAVVTSGALLGVEGPFGDVLEVEPSVEFDPPSAPLMSTFSSYAPEFPGGIYKATTIFGMPPPDGLVAFPKPAVLVAFHTSWKIIFYEIYLRDWDMNAD